MKPPGDAPRLAFPGGALDSNRSCFFRRHLGKA